MKTYCVFQIQVCQHRTLRVWQGVLPKTTTTNQELAYVQESNQGARGLWLAVGCIAFTLGPPVESLKIKKNDR